jgi:hypothetical protein
MSQIGEEISEKINNIIEKVFSNKNQSIDDLKKNLQLTTEIPINIKLYDPNNPDLIHEREKEYTNMILEINKNKELITKITSNLSEKKYNIVKYFELFYKIIQNDDKSLIFNKIDTRDDYDKIGMILYYYTGLIKTKYSDNLYSKIKDILILILQSFMYNCIIYFNKVSDEIADTDAYKLIMFKQFFEDDIANLYSKIYDIEIQNNPTLVEISISPYLYKDIESNKEHYLSLYFKDIYNYESSVDFNQRVNEDYDKLPNNMKLKYILYDLLITYRNIVRNTILQKLLAVKGTTDYKSIVNLIKEKNISENLDVFLDNLLFIDLKKSYIFSKYNNINDVKKDLNNTNKSNVPTSSRLDIKVLHKYLDRIINVSKDDKLQISILDLLEYMYDVVSVLSSSNSKVYNEYNSFILITQYINDKINSNRMALDNIFEILKDYNRDYLDELNSNKDILTYLSIRADNNNINPRYLLSTDEKKSVAMIQYQSNANKVESSTSAKYDTYLVGPFTKIFYNMPPVDMIHDMDIMFSNIKEGKNAIIIGYGSSGSGKTSTLIYRPANKINSNEAPGLLPHICSKIHENNNINKLYLSMDEILDNSGLEEPDELAQLLYKRTEFVFRNDDFYLAEEIKYNNEIVKFKNFQGSETYTFNTKMSLGKYVYIILDTIRKTYPTTNNDRSSRSHIIITIDYNNDKLGKLVICDFAGIENKFDCDSSKVLDAFAKIKFNDKPNLNAYDPIIDKEIRTQYGKYIDLLSNNKNFDDIMKLSDKNKNDNNFSKMMEDNLINIFKEDTTKYILDFILIIRKLPYKSTTSGPADATAVSNYYKSIKLESNFSSLSTNQLNTLFINLGKLLSIPVSLVGSNDQTIKAENLKNIINAVNTNNNQLLDNIIIVILRYIKRNLSSNMIKEQCIERTKEGMFINNSLLELRGFISKVLSTKGITPNYIDICAPLQCNPEWGNCFEQANNSKSGVIAERLNKNKIDINKSILIVFNVINISKDGVSDPPKVPFIDTSELSMEYNRLKNIDISYEAKLDTKLKAQIIESEYLARLSSKIDMYESFISPTDKSMIQEDIKDIKNNDDNMIKLITIDQNKAYISNRSLFNEYRNKAMHRLHKLLLTIDTLRAANPLSTVLFLDMMAKFGLGKNVCMIPSDDQSHNQSYIINKLTSNNLTSLLNKANEMYSKTIFTKD